MGHEPLGAPLLHLEARRGAQIVFARIDCRPAREGHVAQLLHGVGAPAPKVSPVLHEDQRAVLLLQHVAGVELEYAIGAKQRVVTAAVGYRFAAYVRPTELAAIHVDGAAPGARRHGGDVLNAREAQTYLEGKLQTG